MYDFLVAIGLVLVLEGLIFAGLPEQAKRAMENALHTPTPVLRVIGLASAVIGLFLIWIVRG
jgi:uncharacterized protein YjeT (DUF2065 family)